MKINKLISSLPNVSKETLYQYFPRIDHNEYPKLKGYTWEDCHMGSLGAGDLYLASEMADKLDLIPGMKVLELGAGNCLSSIYFAKEYQVTVFAVDLWNSPNDNYRRVKDNGVDNLVIPMQIDAKALPFPRQYFDCIFSMNSFFYFGTDDLYPSYLSSFLKADGKLCIASPCYKTEIDINTPKYLLFDPPDFKESLACHSPNWWHHHFNKTGKFEIVECEEHPKGRIFWMDSVRWQLESGREINDFSNDIKMLLLDEEELITYFTLVAIKKDDVRCTGRVGLVA